MKSLDSQQEALFKSFYELYPELPPWGSATLQTRIEGVSSFEDAIRDELLKILPVAFEWSSEQLKLGQTVLKEVENRTTQLLAPKADEIIRKVDRLQGLNYQALLGLCPWLGTRQLEDAISV